MLRLQKTASQTCFQWIRQSSDPKQEQEDFEKALEKIDQELASRGGPFFLGEQLSLADVSIAPFFERMDAFLTFDKGFRMRGEGKKDLSVYDHILLFFTGKYPCLEAWFAAMEARPTYIATKSDYYTLAFSALLLLTQNRITSEGKDCCRVKGEGSF